MEEEANVFPFLVYRARGIPLGEVRIVVSRVMYLTSCDTSRMAWFPLC